MPRITERTPVRLTPDGPALLRRTIEQGPHGQSEWARRTGISQGTISNLITGRLRRLTYGTAKTLTDALNLHFGDVFEVIPPKPPRTPPPHPTRRVRRTGPRREPGPDTGDPQK